MSGGCAYITGYPLTKNQALQALTLNTLSKAISIGELLQQNKLSEICDSFSVKILFEGDLVYIQEVLSPGFTLKTAFIRDNKQTTAKIFIKNENLICWIDNEVAITCPDLIILLDEKNQPLTTGDLQKGQFVKIIGMPAVSLWRSQKGLALFNPKMFGFPFEPKLL
jgi:DUF917 family protein